MGLYKKLLFFLKNIISLKASAPNCQPMDPFITDIRLSTIEQKDFIFVAMNPFSFLWVPLTLDSS